MPRIRSIKPDAFKSETLSDVSVLARWTFAGLWTYCDDHGKARSDARLIKAELFPIDDSTTLGKVREALDELQEIGAICRYEVGGRGYLHCPKWPEHQRVSHPSASKVPDCPKCAVTCTLEASGEVPEEILKAPEPLVPEQGTGNREQGSGKGTGNARRATQLPDTWTPNEQHRDFAATERIDIEREAAKFRDHAVANGKVQKDWNAAFRNWLRNAVEWRKDAPAPASLPHARDLEQPPDGLSDEEYANWYAAQRARRRA